MGKVWRTDDHSVRHVNPSTLSMKVMQLSYGGKKHLLVNKLIFLKVAICLSALSYSARFGCRSCTGCGVMRDVAVAVCHHGCAGWSGRRLPGPQSHRLRRISIRSEAERTWLLLHGPLSCSCLRTETGTWPSMPIRCPCVSNWRLLARCPAHAAFQLACHRASQPALLRGLPSAPEGVS